jgi:hypothetical protein
MQIFFINRYWYFLYKVGSKIRNNGTLMFIEVENRGASRAGIPRQCEMTMTLLFFFEWG